MFPPLPIVILNVDYMASKIWAMFGDAYRKIDRYYKFLDWQYIFRPLNFTVMAGGNGKSFARIVASGPYGIQIGLTLINPPVLRKGGILSENGWRS
jgi:hypothetical protein